MNLFFNKLLTGEGYHDKKIITKRFGYESIKEVFSLALISKQPSNILLESTRNC